MLYSVTKSFCIVFESSFIPLLVYLTSSVLQELPNFASGNSALRTIFGIQFFPFFKGGSPYGVSNDGANENHEDDDGETATTQTGTLKHSSRKERIKFSKEDWNLIFAHFGMLITSDRTEGITTKAVTEILKNPALADLVKVLRK